MDQLWELALILALFVGMPAMFCWLMRGLEKGTNSAESKEE